MSCEHIYRSIHSNACMFCGEPENGAVAPPGLPESVAYLAEHDHFEAWWEYHSDNPDAYTYLVKKARAQKAKGERRGAIQHLIENSRNDEHVGFFTMPSGFQDKYRTLYARLIMAREEDLAGFFEVRRLRAVAP